MRTNASLSVRFVRIKGRRLDGAAAAIYGWDCPLLTFTYRVLIVIHVNCLIKGDCHKHTAEQTH